jgi:prepilin peptidase CpaA
MFLLTLLPPLLLLIVASVYDLRSRTVPDWIAACIAGWGLVMALLGWHPAGPHIAGWWGLAGGLLLGLVLTAPLFFLGAFGGADVKLVAALGALLGPLALLLALFWVALAGGLLAAVAAARGKRDLAYVPAITAGLGMYFIYSGYSGGLSNFVLF